MKRIKILVICLALCLLSAVGFTACGKKVNKLTFEVIDSVNAEVGNYYTLPVVSAEDGKGNIYSPEIKVSDPLGGDVIIEDGRVFIDYVGEYKIDYTVLFNDEAVKKTTTLHSADNTDPTIKLDSTEDYEIKGSDYTIPVPVYEDNYTPAAQLQTSVTVEFGGQKITPEQGKITLESEGEYTITYTAKDSSGNEATETLTVNSFTGEADSITYFNREFGASKITLREGMGSVAAVKDRALPGDEYSLKFSIGSTAAEPDNKKGVGGLFLNHPYIKDVTVYDYLYFYVYTDTENVGVTFNSIYSANRIKADMWNKIVLTKTAVDGGKIDYVTPWGTKVFYDAYSESWVGDPADITDMLIWLYVPADTGANVWFSAIKGTNSLPQTEVMFDSTYTLGTIELPVATVAGKDNVTQKVFVKSGEDVTEITKSSYTFAKAGSYLFHYQVFSDGKLIDIVEKTVLAIEEEPGNLTYFNHEFGADNVSHNGMTGTSEASKEKVVSGEEYSLKHTNNSIWGSSCIVVDKAYKTDITEYKYLYFYIYVDKAGSGITFNAIYSGDRSLVPGVWNRIVLTRNNDSTNYTTPWGTNVFDLSTSVTPTNMDGFMFYVYHPENVNTTIYLSAMRGTNDEPQYATVDMEGTVSKNTEFDIPEAAGVDDLTQKVYLISGNTATEITTEKYTLTENGVYTFAFEVYSAGKLVNTVKKTVTVYDEEPGNITYFNQPFGISVIGAPNAVVPTIVTSKRLGAEASSLECQLQAPGYWPTIKIASPFIKNLNVKDGRDNYLYDYVIFFVYTDATNTNISICNAAGPVIPAGVWTRVTLVRNGDTFYYNGTDVFSGDYTTTASDITDMQILFDTSRESAYTTVYISTMRALKTLPELETEFADRYFTGEQIDLTPSVTEGYTVKTYYLGEAYDTADKFTAADGGTYKFVYEVSKDGVIYDMVTKNVLVIQKEDDNLTYFNKSFGAEFATPWSTDSTVTASTEKVHGDDEYSLKVSAPAPYWGVAGVWLNKSVISDISAHKYLYFYVYTDDENVKFNGTQTAVAPGVWNKVVLKRGDDGAYTSCAGLTLSAARAQNMTSADTALGDPFGILLGTQGTQGAFAGVTFYISSVRVTDSLAEENAVLNFSTSEGAAEVGTPNALAFGPTKTYSYNGEECSTEFYLQAIGYPTIKVTAPKITNLNTKDSDDNYIYDYVYFYAYVATSATSLMIGNAGGELLTANTWTKVVLERNGDTFYYNGADVFGGDGEVTAADITGLQILFNNSAEAAWNSVFLTSWRAVKTLPQV